MTINSLVVKSVTPGTLVRVTSDEALRAHKVIVEVIPGATDEVYLGLAGLVRATLVNVMHIFRVAAAGENPVPYEISPLCGGNVIRLSDLYIDADAGTEGVLVTYFVL